MDQNAEVKGLLQSVRTVAVVGLSADEEKPSNVVARYLISKGFHVIPVNPGLEDVLGRKSYKSISEIPDKVDVVDIFMRSERVLPIVEEAVRLKPKAIWLQLGIKNDEAMALAAENDIMFVMDKCIKQEHSRLLPTPQSENPTSRES